jgi:hypothetical protein
MAYDSGLVTRVDDALRTLGERGARQKNVFGGRGFLAGKSTFVIVFDDDLIVKVPPAEYDAASPSAASPPSPPTARARWEAGSSSRATRSPTIPSWPSGWSGDYEESGGGRRWATGRQERKRKDGSGAHR